MDRIGNILGKSMEALVRQQTDAQALLAERNHDEICPSIRAECTGWFDTRAGNRGLMRTTSIALEWLVPCPIDAIGECPWVQQRAAHRQQQRLASIGFGRRTFGAQRELVPASIAERLDIYCETISHRLAAGEGIIISGPPGNGKTHCLALIALAADCKAVRYVTCADLFDRLHRDREVADAEYRDCGLLLLDDLGTQYNAEWGLTGFLALMDYRYREMKSTCIATNLSAADVKGALGYANTGNIERMLDRLRETNVWWPIAEASQRRPVALDDWLADNDSEAEAMFRQEVDGDGQ